MGLDAKGIRELLDSWIGALLSGSGRPDDFAFLNNSVVVHELDFDQLIECLIGLSKFSLNASGGQFYFQEHRLVWAWCFQVLCVSGMPMFPPNHDDLNYRFNLATLANLALVQGSAAMQFLNHASPDPVQHLALRSSRIMEYMAFPVLEATCKRAMSAYFDMSGTVLQSYKIETHSGRSFGKAVGCRCSSLEELLWVLYRNVSKQHQNALDRIDEIFKVLGVSKHCFGVIYDWRNDSLHGDEASPIPAMLLNVILVIGLFSTKDSYDFNAKRVRGSMKHSKKYCPATLHFYPPN